MNDGLRPTTVGLFFSLGHSSVVVLLTVGVIFSSQFISTHLDDSKEIGSIVGTSVSAFFLLLIGAINVRVLGQSYAEWRALRRGDQPVAQVRYYTRRHTHPSRSDLCRRLCSKMPLPKTTKWSVHHRVLPPCVAPACSK